MFPIFTKLGGLPETLKVLERRRGKRLSVAAVRSWRHKIGRVPAINMLPLMEECDARAISYTAADFEPESPVRRQSRRKTARKAQRRRRSS